jgi:hypothetical protein
MATVSNAGAGMSFSNAQQGTRGLSAGDRVRLKRLRGQVIDATVVDGIKPTADQLPYSLPIHVYKTVGTSKIRRPASNWVDYIASQKADFVLSSQAKINATSVKNTVTKLCDCTTSNLTTKQGICTKCNQTTHVRIM